MDVLADLINRAKFVLVSSNVREFQTYWGSIFGFSHTENMHVVLKILL